MASARSSTWTPGRTSPIAPPSSRWHLRERAYAHLIAWWPVWVAFTVSRVGVLVVGTLTYHAAQNRGIEHLVPLPRTGAFVRLASIVTNGYHPQNVSEYPLLPGLMSFLKSIGIPLPLGALLISHVAFLIGLLGFAMLGERYVGRPAAIRAATYLTVFPTAYFFSIGSTESVTFAALTAAALLALRGTWQSWLAAGCAAALCALSRPQGALVAVILLAIAISQLRRDRLAKPAVGAALAAIMAVPAAIFGFFLYLEQRTGDFFAVVHAQEDFGRKPISLANVPRAIGSAINGVGEGILGEAFDLAAAVAVAAAALVFASRALGDRWEVWGWVAFASASLLVPLATGVVWQMPRFVLLIPPLFWILGVIGRRQWLHLGLLLLLPMGLAFRVMFEVETLPPRPAEVPAARSEFKSGDAVPQGKARAPQRRTGDSR
jgi:hypothetical protein